MVCCDESQFKKLNFLRTYKRCSICEKIKLGRQILKCRKCKSYVHERCTRHDFAEKTVVWSDDRGSDDRKSSENKSSDWAETGNVNVAELFNDVNEPARPNGALEASAASPLARQEAEEPVDGSQMALRTESGPVGPTDGDFSRSSDGRGKPQDVQSAEIVTPSPDAEGPDATTVLDRIGSQSDVDIPSEGPRAEGAENVAPRLVTNVTSENEMTDGAETAVDEPARPDGTSEAPAASPLARQGAEESVDGSLASLSERVPVALTVDELFRSSDDRGKLLDVFSAKIVTPSSVSDNFAASTVQDRMEPHAYAENPTESLRVGDAENVALCPVTDVTSENGPGDRTETENVESAETAVDEHATPDGTSEAPAASPLARQGAEESVDGLLASSSERVSVALTVDDLLRSSDDRGKLLDVFSAKIVSPSSVSDDLAAETVRDRTEPHAYAENPTESLRVGDAENVTPCPVTDVTSENEPGDRTETEYVDSTETAVDEPATPNGASEAAVDGSQLASGAESGHVEPTGGDVSPRASDRGKTMDAPSAEIVADPSLIADGADATTVLDQIEPNAEGLRADYPENNVPCLEATVVSDGVIGCWITMPPCPDVEWSVVLGASADGAVLADGESWVSCPETGSESVGKTADRTRCADRTTSDVPASPLAGLVDRLKASERPGMYYLKKCNLMKNCGIRSFCGFLEQIGFEEGFCPTYGIAYDHTAAGYTVLNWTFFPEWTCEGRGTTEIGALEAAAHLALFYLQFLLEN